MTKPSIDKTETHLKMMSVDHLTLRLAHVENNIQNFTIEED